MNVVEMQDDKTTLKVVVDSNEESLFSLVKVYLNQMPEVDVAGYVSEHHLVDKTEFFVKVSKGSALDVFKKGLVAAKKDLESRKLK